MSFRGSGLSPRAYALASCATALLLARPRLSIAQTPSCPSAAPIDCGVRNAQAWTPQEHHERGMRRFSQRDYLGAFCAFKDASEVTTDESLRGVELVSMGRCQNDLGRTEEAILSLRRGLDMSGERLPREERAYTESTLQTITRRFVIETHRRAISLRERDHLRHQDQMDRAYTFLRCADGYPIAPETHLDLARTIRSHFPVDAVAHFTAALADPSYARSPQLVAEIQRELADVRQHVGALLVAPIPPGATISIQGLTASPAASTPLPVDEGPTTVTIRAHGCLPWTHTIVIAPHATTQIDGRLGCPLALTTRSAYRTVAWATGGAALALLTGGGLAWGIGQSAADQWNDDAQCLRPGTHRRDVCGELYDRAELARPFAYTGLISGVVAGVLSGVFSGLFFHVGSPPRLRALCVPLPGTWGASCGASF